MKQYDIERLEKELYEKKQFNIIANEIGQKLAHFPTITKISEHVAYADYFIEFDVETLQDAYEIMEKSNPLPVFLVKDSCTSFRPEAFIKDNEKEKSTLVSPYRYSIDQCQNYPAEHTFIFYINIEPAGIIEVRAKINKPEARINFSCVYDRAGTPKREKCELINENSSYFNKRITFWSPESSPSPYVLYSL